MKFEFKKKYKFNTSFTTQAFAVESFNLYRAELEKLHQAKIKVIGMYRNWIADFIVEYVLEECE